MPTWGFTSSNPSFDKALNASRTGVRDTLYLDAISVSLIALPGTNLRLKISSLKPF